MEDFSENVHFCLLLVSSRILLVSYFCDLFGFRVESVRSTDSLASDVWDSIVQYSLVSSPRGTAKHAFLWDLENEDCYITGLPTVALNTRFCLWPRYPISCTDTISKNRKVQLVWHILDGLGSFEIHCTGTMIYRPFGIILVSFLKCNGQFANFWNSNAQAHYIRCIVGTPLHRRVVCLQDCAGFCVH